MSTTERIDMTALADQNIKDRTLFSAFMFNLLGDDQESLFMQVHEASADKRYYEVDLKINGVPIKIRPFMELIEKQLDRMIAERAGTRSRRSSQASPRLFTSLNGS